MKVWNSSQTSRLGCGCEWNGAEGVREWHASGMAGRKEGRTSEADTATQSAALTYTSKVKHSENIIFTFPIFLLLSEDL